VSLQEGVMALDSSPWDKVYSRTSMLRGGGRGSLESDFCERDS
jgi:hypothetical protein